VPIPSIKVDSSTRRRLLLSDRPDLAVDPSAW